MSLAFWAGFGVASLMWIFLMVWAWCAAAGDADEAMIRHAEWGTPDIESDRRLN